MVEALVKPSPRRFAVEIQHPRLLMARRINRWLTWTLMLGPMGTTMLLGPMLLADNHGKPPLGILPVLGYGLATLLSFAVGVVLASLSIEALPRRYLKRHPGLSRAEAVITADADGLHIEGLASFAWPGLTHTELVRGDDYNSSDIIVSSIGRLPVRIDSAQHIDDLVAEIAAQRARISTMGRDP